MEGKSELKFLESVPGIEREKLFGVRSVKHYPLRSISKWVIEQCPAREETSREEMTG